MIAGVELTWSGAAFAPAARPRPARERPGLDRTWSGAGAIAGAELTASRARICKGARTTVSIAGV